MPALPDQWITVKGDDETKFSEKVTASVTVEGDFNMGIPPALKDIAMRLMRDHVLLKDTGHVEYAKHRYGAEPRLTAKCLAYCLNFLRACAQDYLKCEVITDRVIAYDTKIDVSMWVNEDGSLAANGVVGDGGGEWWRSAGKQAQFHSGNRLDFMAVGVKARVFDRFTYRRSSGDTIKWGRANDEKDEALNELNAFGPLDIDPSTEHYQIMPYTPQAARFFSRMMLAICELGRQMDGFFADPKRLNKAIQSPAMLPWGK